MRNFVLGVSLTLCVAFGGLLLQSSKPVEAGGNIDPKAVVGHIYGVSNIDSWRKSLPVDNRGNKQTELDRQLIDRTHYVYETGSTDWEKRINFQRIMIAALRDGWTIESVDEQTLSATMWHPKISVNELALKPTKR